MRKHCWTQALTHLSKKGASESIPQREDRTPSHTPLPLQKVRKNPFGCSKDKSGSTQKSKATLSARGYEKTLKKRPECDVARESTDSSQLRADSPASPPLQDQGIASALGELTNTLKKVVKQ